MKEIKKKPLENILNELNVMDSKRQQNEKNEALIKPNGEKYKAKPTKLSKFNKNKKLKKEKCKNRKSCKKTGKLNLSYGHSSDFQLFIFVLFKKRIIICDSKKNAPFKAFENILKMRFKSTEKLEKAYKDLDPQYDEFLLKLFGEK